MELRVKEHFRTAGRESIHGETSPQPSPGAMAEPSTPGKVRPSARRAFSFQNKQAPPVNPTFQSRHRTSLWLLVALGATTLLLSLPFLLETLFALVLPLI